MGIKFSISQDKMEKSHMIPVTVFGVGAGSCAEICPVFLPNCLAG